MKLQRYKLDGECGSYYEFFKHPNGDWVKDSDVAELESALCETCKDPRCEDSVVEHLKHKVARLEKALESCHCWHNTPRICADMVDKYYHELFPEAYNPHKEALGGGE